METAWEFDDDSGNGASSILSKSSSSQDNNDDDAYYFNDPETKMTSTATITAKRSNDDRSSSLQTNPPPRDDCSDDDDNVDSEFEDDDDLSLNDHIIIAAARQGFGDETMDVLMDAEKNLNVVLPPPPPPPSSPSLSSNKNGKKEASNNIDADENSTGDDDISELSDGVASLLRGPIMAAKSFAQITKQEQQIIQQRDDDDGYWEDTPSKVRMASSIATEETAVNEESTNQTTPSATRKEFISSAQKMEPWSPWSIQQQQQSNSTPSATRVRFMPSAQKEQDGSDFTTTPSTSRREFIQSAQKSERTQPWSPWSSQHLQKQESDTPSAARLKFLPSAQKETSSSPSHCTPSTARSGFISSPSAGRAKWSLSSSPASSIAEQRECTTESPHQDSLSSIGANSPSAYAQQPQTQYRNMQRLDNSRPQQQTPPNVTFESSATPSLASPLEIKRKSPVSAEAEAFLQMNQHILNKEKAMDNIIELGERQMKMGVAASSNNNNNNDKDASKDNLPPVKKPFLRRGARKEPSALHKRGHLNSNMNKMTTTPPDASSTTESASERKARLEQLEKMQEDLMKDLERRKMRKEEAQKERRREKEVVGSMKNSSGGGSAARSAVKSPKRTPLQSRPRSVNRANNAGDCEEQDGGRQNTNTKSQTFTKSAKSSKVKPSPRDLSFSPTPIVEGKSLQGSSNSNNNVANKNMIETCQTKSLVQVRARSTSRPRSLVQRSNNNNNKSGEKSSDLDAKAIEDMKKKEEEQMALIQNMRRRQEAALREAEGERERAKAWAAAEKESVKKWVEEQRALIRKDRHKAANAALLASRRASRGKQDEDTNEEEDALKAELEEMRVEMKKMKVEAEEARKLKEQVRRQERIINSLKRGDDTVNYTSNSKNVDAGKPRTALGDRTSKENVQQRPKTAGINVVVGNANKQPVVTKERPYHEPTDSENDLVDDRALPQRKPYNAADYAGGKQEMQAHPIPQFVSAPTPPGQGGQPSQIVTYQNGTTKEVLPDGTTTISFANGDRKRTYANEKKGIEVYYYAATKTTQVTHQDGSNSFHFPNKQIEHHFRDGRKEITFPDGTKQIAFPDGVRDTTFPDGMRLIDYPDGNQRVVTSS